MQSNSAGITADTTMSIVCYVLQKKEKTDLNQLQIDLYRTKKPQLDVESPTAAGTTNLYIKWPQRLCVVYCD